LNLDFRLERLRGALYVKVRPFGSEVLVDGKKIGRTPLNRNLPTGRVEVEVRKEGHHPLKRTVRVRFGKTAGLTETLQAIPKGTLIVQSVPAGATILVDGKEMGKTPRALGLYARAYNLVLRKALYKRLTLTVRVRPGRAERVSHSLTRVRVLETAAEIARTIDGKRYLGIVALSGVLSHIAGARSDLGDKESARKTIRDAFQMSGSAQSNWQSYALAEIVKGQKGVRDKAFALRNFARAFELAKPIPRRFWRALALKDIAKAQADAGDQSAARRTLAEVTDADMRAFAKDQETRRRDFGVAHGKAGNTSKAQRIFEQAAAATQNEIVKRFVVAAMARAGMIQAAIKMAWTSDNSEFNARLGAIAEAQARSGDVAGALKTLGKMSSGSKWGVQGAHLQIVKGKVRAGDLQGALSIAKDIDGYGSVRVDALLEVANGQIRAGDKTGALRTLALSPPEVENLRRFIHPLCRVQQDCRGASARRGSEDRPPHPGSGPKVCKGCRP